MTTDDAIKTAVEQIVQAKVAEALTGGNALVKIIDSVMTQKVRSSGWGPEKTYLQQLLEGSVESAIASAVRDFLAERDEEIKAHVKAKLSVRAEDVAAQIIAGVLDDDWRCSINVKFGKED